MKHARLRIVPQKGRAGRIFEVTLLNLVTADGAWKSGTSSTETMRPVYCSFLGTDQEVQAFVANLRMGRKAQVISERGYEYGAVEFPRSGGFRYAAQKLGGEAALRTIYLPELLEIEPAGVPAEVRFLFAPPTWWVTEQADTLLKSSDLAMISRFARETGARGAAVASYFAAYLDRRISLPLPNHPLFHLRLYEAAETIPWFKRPGGLHWRRGPLFAFPERLEGLETLALVDATTEAAEQFVYDQSRRFFEEGGAFALGDRTTRHGLEVMR